MKRLPYPPRPAVRMTAKGIYFETREHELRCAVLTRNGWRVRGQNYYTRRWFTEFKGA